MSDICKALVNTILVSIPEESLWVILTLIFLERFDLLDFKRWKYNLGQIMIPVIPSSMVINICIYILHNRNIKLIATIPILCFLIIYIVKKNNFLNVEILDYKVVLYTILASFLFAITECIYAPILLYMIDKPIEYINNHVFYNWISASPSRILQIIFISIVYIKSNKTVKVNTLKNIIKDKILLIGTTIFTGIILVIVFFVMKIIGDHQFFRHLSLIIQLLISIIMLLIPTFLLSIHYIMIEHLMSRIVYQHQSFKNSNDED